MPNALGQTRLLTQLHCVSLLAVSPRMRSEVLDAHHTSTEVRPHTHPFNGPFPGLPG